MYNIGKFSDMCDTSVQTLRYYDSIDLLSPKIIGCLNSDYLFEFFCFYIVS